MKLKRPKSWRKGQTIFNFLEWLYRTEKIKANEQSPRMADPFFVDDKDWDKWYKEFLRKHKK